MMRAEHFVIGMSTIHITYTYSQAKMRKVNVAYSIGRDGNSDFFCIASCTHSRIYRIRIAIAAMNGAL